MELGLGTLAGIGLGGDLFSAYANHREGVASRNFARDEGFRSRVFNAEQAQLSRNFTERMSNTAHQREIKDLMLAGLNPILSAGGGAGASTPSGATASSGMASSGTPSIGSITHSALAAVRLKEELKQIRETTKNIETLRPGIIADNSAKAAAARQAWLGLPKGETKSGWWERLRDFSADQPHSAREIFRSGEEVREKLKGDWKSFSDRVGGARDRFLDWFRHGTKPVPSKGRSSPWSR